MKVKCIDNTKCENILQVGHIYDAEYHHLSNDVFMINHIGAYSKDMFEVVEDDKWGENMKVKCINNKGYENGLDVGEVYDVISFMHGFYELINKWGEKRCFEINRFELIEETKIGLDVLDISQVGGSHYNKNDPIQFARDNYPREQLEGFFRINIDKYVARYDRKNGVEDLRKAQHYLTLLIDLIDKSENND